MRRILRITGGLLALLFLGTTGAADDVYLEPEAFLAEAFPAGVPEKQFVWLKGELRDRVAEALGHRYRQLRIGYWQAEGRTAWILEEIGKVEPITAGFLVESAKIERFRVLVYREAYGWEIRYPFFTRQFEDVGLTEDDSLDESIDGISGATLSVDAVTRLAAVALILHENVAITAAPEPAADS